MTARIHTESYLIGSHFLPYFINGDATGLTDAEENEADEWLELVRGDAPKGYSFEHLSPEGEEEEFGLCQITRQRGQCHPVEAVFFHRDA